MKPILALEFDKVIHGMDSRWRGPWVIMDPPVPGALEFIVKALPLFSIQVYSRRSSYFGARWIMKSWLRQHYRHLMPSWKATPEWLKVWLAVVESGDWADEARYAARSIVGLIGFPRRKPMAHVSIDANVIAFDGTFPDPQDLLELVPIEGR